MSIQRLPQFAEHHFASLCSKAGVICNPSIEDECGWDFHLQFPKEKSDGRPADLQPPAFEAFVQVKSRQAAPLTARLKLSNALAASHSNQPQFLVLVAKPEAGSSPRIYARHLWEDEIFRSLKRVRQAESKGEKKLNRKTISFTFDESDDRGDDLLEWMLAVIKAQRPSYGAAKSKLATTVGYDGDIGAMQFRFSADRQELEEWQVGLKEDVRVEALEITSKRFGISLPMGEPELQGGRLSVDSSAGPCQLRLQAGHPTSELVLDGELFGIPMPLRAKAHQKWRVEAGPLRIIGGDGERYETRVSVGFKEVRSIQDIYEILWLFSRKPSERIKADLFHDSKRIPMGHLELSTEQTWDVLRLVEPLETLRAIERADHNFDARAALENVFLTIDQLTSFHGLIDSRSLQIEYEPVDQDASVRAAIYYVGYDLADWSFLALIERTVGSDEMQGKRRRIWFENPKLLEGMVRKGCWKDHKPEIAKSFEEHIERLGDRDTLWDIGDFLAFHKKYSAPTSG